MEAKINRYPQSEVDKLKNSLLSKNLDLDYVEILIREKFVYTKKGEKIYVLKNDN